MKKIFLFILIFFIFTNSYSAHNLETYSENVLLYNLTNNEIIYEKGSNVKTSIASLTKIMTSLIAIEYIDDLDKKITITQNDLAGLKEQQAAVAGFKINEEVTYNDLLYGLMLPSGADAALALANNTYKSEQEFIKKMNDLKNKIGLKNTNFTTTTGLDTPNNYSTLNDLVKLLKYALKNDTFYKIYTTKKYTTSNNKHVFENSFFKIKNRFDLDLDFVIGAKTGTTDDAGLCLISLAEYNNKQYILVTTKAPFSYTNPYNSYDAEKIYNYFFDNFDYKFLLNKNDLIKNVKINNSLEKSINIYSLDNVEMYLSNNINLNEIKYNYNSLIDLNYKIKPGTKIGTLDIKYKEDILKTINIYLNNKIHYNYYKLLLIPVFIFFLLFSIRINNKRKKKRLRRKS